MRTMLLLGFCISLAGAQAQDTLGQAMAFYSAGSYERAVIIVDDYLGAHPGDTTALGLAGDAYHQLKLHHIAAQRYTRAIQAGIKRTDVRINRARCYFYMEEYKASRLEWQAICQQYPDSNDWRYYYALSCQYCNDYAGAIRQLTLALDHDPSFILARKARANLYLKTQKHQEALSDIDSVLMITQYDETMFMNRGLALIGLKRYQESERTFKRIIDHDEKNQHAWFGLGSMYYASRNFTKAVDAFDIVIAINPVFELAYFKRGLAQLELRQNEKGCADLMKSLELGYSESLSYLKKFCNHD